MRWIAITLGLGLAPALYGCVHSNRQAEHIPLAEKQYFISHGAEFIIQGTARNASTGDPVPYANTHFVDTGLDYHHGKAERRIRIGTADRDGGIDQRFQYGWCIVTSFNALGVVPPVLNGIPEEDQSTVLSDALNEALMAAAMPQRFAIEIECEGFATFRKDVDFRSIPEHGNAYLVDLGAVVLMPSPSAISGEGLE